MLITFILVLWWSIVSFILQIPMGISSYLYNWEEDRNIWEEINSAKMLRL